MTIEKILNKSGQFSSVKWERKAKTLKSCTAVITKSVIANNVRIGARYDNLKAVKEARENGELPSENQGLRGMHWVQYPILLQSDYDENKYYVRLETAKNSQFKTVWTINGEPTEKSEIEQYLQASEKKSGDMPTVMNINLDQITEIK